MGNNGRCVERNVCPKSAGRFDMETILRILLIGWFAFMLVVYTVRLGNAWEAEAKEMCEAMGVPYEIVRAIVEVESGGDPLVLNVALSTVWKAYHFNATANAKAFLLEAVKITDRIDIGLMQVHWRVWKKHYDIEPVMLLDMTTNLTIGCDILRRELAGDGPLWRRIGRYHSRTPALNQRYAQKVLTYATTQK